MTDKLTPETLRNMAYTVDIDSIEGVEAHADAWEAESTALLRVVEAGLALKRHPDNPFMFNQLMATIAAYKKEFGGGD